MAETHLKLSAQNDVLCQRAAQLTESGEVLCPTSHPWSDQEIQNDTNLLASELLHMRGSRDLKRLSGYFPSCTTFESFEQLKSKRYK